MKNPVPFYFDKEQEDITVFLTDEEERHRREDYMEYVEMKKYHGKFHEKWKRGAAVYNLLHDRNVDERMSNVFVPLARMIIDTGISMMTEGQPDFDFAPLGPSDAKKVILWKSMIKMLLSRCNWRSHQEKFIADLHVFGSSALEVYTQLPYRTRRYEKEDGTIEERVVRDFRRSKVGIRHASIWDCMRNPNVSDPDDVPSGWKRERMTWNQFVQNYAIVILPNGKPKYDRDNIKQLPKGTHVEVKTKYDEIGDVNRVYVVSYGTNPEGEAGQPPEELGLPIFNKPLCIYTMDKNGYRSAGANVPGMVPLCFGVFNDQFDLNGKTHALYGMGIPEMIAGPDDATQALFNMHLDNVRLNNTVVIGYEPNDGVTFPDFDNRLYYSGDFVDGKVTPQALGNARTDLNQAQWEYLNNLCIWTTGINFQQLVGDTSGTAFEFAQRIRMNNQRAEKRIRSLEDGPLKRAATLLLANGLSETTVEEWEDLSEEQAEAIGERLGRKEGTAEDYQMEGGKAKRRRVHTYIPIEGKKLREDFKGNSKRKLDYHGASNTLIEDPNMEGDISYIPAVPQYLYPTEYIESGMLPDVIVDGKRMLGDLKAQDMEMMTKTGEYLRQRFAETAGAPGMEDQVPDVDLKKFDKEFLKFAGLDDGKLSKNDDKGSEMQKQAKKALEQATSILSPDAPPPMAPAPANAPAAPAPAQPALSPPSALTATAGGTL